MFRRRLATSMQRYHEYYHLAFGFIGLLISLVFFPNLYLPLAMIVTAIGSFWADIDHLLFLFIYGRNSAYAVAVRQYLQQRRFGTAIEFCRLNHKCNCFILSHNLLTLVVFIFLSLIFIDLHRPILTIFCLATSSHFLFDILEDFIALGRLNSNWYLKFQTPSLIGTMSPNHP